MWYTVKNWINQYRVRTLRIQTLDATYHDADSVLMHAVFQVLVDYVEVDCAWKNVVFDRELLTWDIRLKHALGLEFRSRHHGVAHLRWEQELRDENGNVMPQADKAKKVYDLYWWWKNARKFRIDPWSLVTAKLDPKWPKWFSGTPLSDDDFKAHELYLKQCDDAQRLEEQYYREDGDKMKELIDLRENLWT